MSTQASFGRPEDKDIQKEFMRKIRGDKLQAINAECELEICLAFNNGQRKQKSKNKRSKKKDTEDNTQQLQNQMMLVAIGALGPERRGLLHEKFVKLKQDWKFEEIGQNQPLPDYFFQDGCDLSYILYQLQKMGEEFQKFSAEDLIFLELLCLEGRKLLNKEIIEYYQQNMSFMIPAMDSGLEKINQKLKEYRDKGGQKLKQRKVSNQQGENDYGSSGENENTDRKQNEKKTKKIKKKPNDKKGKKGSVKKGQSSSQEVPEEQEMENEQKIELGTKELALKTCNYISWAYWYIIKK